MMTKNRKIVFVSLALTLAVLAVSAFAFWDEIGSAYRSLTKQPDKHGVYRVDDYYMEYAGAYSEKSAAGFVKKLNSIKSTYLTADNRTFYAIVPDKAYYAQDAGYPVFDYASMQSAVRAGLTEFTEIDLFPVLSLTDYYKTDIHWRQDKLAPTVMALGDTMGFAVDAQAFTAQTQEGFVGSYAKSITGKAPADTLVYLTSPVTDAANVENYQYPDFHAVYDTARLASKLPYDVFLSGASPVITIENPLATSEQSLIIFRDSFASSLAPLLLPAYKSITLIDLRYMATPLLRDFVAFDKQDVLFLYSVPVVNSSAMLR